MKLIKLLGFLLQFTILGLAAAFLVLYFRPQWLEQQAPPPSPGITSFAAAVDSATHAVINVHVTSESEDPGIESMLDDPTLREYYQEREGLLRRRRSSLGSGVIVSESGYALTNDHLIRDAEDIRVTLWDGTEYGAALVGTDPESDLAVLRIDAPRPLRWLPFSQRSLAVGDIVLAIGNPFGVGQTVTMGIVSATGRQDLAINSFEDFIQTDAAINPGNSGGALINTAGELVGINSAVFAEQGAQGISFAIPTDLAATVMDQIVTHGRVIRGWLGVDTIDLNWADGTRGVLISAVEYDSPAADAGLLPGDLVLRVEGTPVVTSRTLLDLVAARPPGTPVRITFLRRGSENQVTAVLSERPPPG